MTSKDESPRQLIERLHGYVTGVSDRKGYTEALQLIEARLAAETEEELQRVRQNHLNYVARLPPLCCGGHVVHEPTCPVLRDAVKAPAEPVTRDTRPCAVDGCPNDATWGYRRCVPHMRELDAEKTTTATTDGEPV